MILQVAGLSLNEAESTIEDTDAAAYENSFSEHWLAEIPRALYELRYLVAAAVLNLSLFPFSIFVIRRPARHKSREKNRIAVHIYNNVFNRRLHTKRMSPGDE